MKQILSVWIRVCLCPEDWLKCSWDLLQFNAMEAKQISGTILRIRSQQAAICLMSYFFIHLLQKENSF